MPGQFSTALMFASLVAIALATNQVEKTESLGLMQARGPASIASVRKLELTGFKAPNEVRHTTKLRGPLHASVEIMGDAPESVGDVFIVRGTIQSRENLDRVEYSWSLPDGIELVNGEVQGTVSSVMANHPVNVELTVKKTKPENLKIHFIAGAMHGSGRIADAAQLNTERPKQAEVEEKSLRVFH